MGVAPLNLRASVQGPHAWRDIGPKGFGNGGGVRAGSGSPVIGRVNCVAYDPSEPSTRYIGAALGGVWKSTDGGASWRPLSNAWPSQAVSSVAVNAQNRVFAGTGDWPNEDLGYRIGVMQSDDGGLHWKKVAAVPSSQIISCVAVDPDLPEVAFAAEWNGSLWRFDGKTWTVPAGLEDFTSAYWMGIVFGLPADNAPRSCYAICEGQGGTIFVSTDHGASWGKLWYPKVSGFQRRTMLVTSATTSGRLYLCLPEETKADGTLVSGGVFMGDAKPGSATVNWQNITGSFDPFGASWYQDSKDPKSVGASRYVFSMCCAKTVIDGREHDVVYVGRGGIWQKVIGVAGDWQDMGRFENPPKGVFYDHADQHALAVNPHDRTQALIGCDGGVFEFRYDGQTDTVEMESLNADLSIAECYKIAASRHGDWVLAGTQDTGSPAVIPGGAPGFESSGGDGGACAISPDNALIQYSTGDFHTGDDTGKVRSTRDGWVEFTASAETSGSTHIDLEILGSNVDRPKVDSPIVIDPTHTNLVYIATNFLYRWDESTQTLTKHLGGKPLSKAGSVNAIAIAKADSNRIYTCSDDGQIFRSANRGGSWSDITGSLGFPKGSFKAISVSPVSENDVLVGIDSSDSPPAGGRLWRCFNGGDSTPLWMDVSGDPGPGKLPDAPVNAIVRDFADPDATWYVATTIGVYRTTDQGHHWTNWWSTHGAPVVWVRDLVQVGKRLLAGTYGRGIWEYYEGTLQLFYMGMDFQIKSLWRDPDGTWSGEQRIDGPIGKGGGPRAAIVPNSDVLQLFYRGPDNGLWSCWRNSDGSWSVQDPMGGKLGGAPIAAVVPGTNVLQVFYCGPDQTIRTRWRNPNGSWSGEHKLGGIAHGNPVAATVPIANVLQLFYRGADNGIWSRWRDLTGTWSGEQSLGGNLAGDPVAAVVPGSNVLQLFYRGNDSQLWTTWRNPDGGWSQPGPLGGHLAGNPAAARIPGTNILQLFYRGSDGTLKSQWRDPDGNWSDEQPLQAKLDFDPVAAAIPGTNLLEVFYRRADTIWSRQRYENGRWSQEKQLGGQALGNIIAVELPQ